MRILVTPTFERTVKKLHGQQKADVDAAVKAVASDISIGEEKWVILLGPACTNSHDQSVVPTLLSGTWY